MMSGHEANSIFFNKEIMIGRLEHSPTPHPPTSDNISFLPYLPPPLEVDVICVSPLNIQLSRNLITQSRGDRFREYINKRQ